MSIITIIEELIVRRRTIVVSDAAPVRALPASSDADAYRRTLNLNHPDRYTILDSCDDYGQHEALDNRTGRTGMMMSGFGFVAGAHVRDDGRVAFEHPWDNPLQGCDWGG